MKSKYMLFEELPVWEDSQKLAVEIYQDFRECRDFSFFDQIKRAVVSISNNIAEGAERTSYADFARFLDIAKGLAGEVRSMLHLAEKLEFISKSTREARHEACTQISKQLSGFTKHLRNSTN